MAGLGPEIVQIHARIGDESVTIGFDGGGILVMLVGDIAHDFLDNVFDRNQPVGTAIFVDHQRQMGMGGLHLEQQVQRPHGGRREQDGAAQAGDARIR